jgi:flagella basal body P-ring formation protein FlgA
MLCGGVYAATGTPIEPLEDIRNTARMFVVEQSAGTGSTIDVKVGALDPRLRLPRCGMPLNAYFSPGARTAGHTTVGIRCDSDKPWTLFVPVTIIQSADVLVASRTLTRGQLVTGDDVVIERRQLKPAQTGYFFESEAVLGKVVTRAVTAKTPLTPSMLKSPRLVRRGDRVQLAWSGGSVNVRMSGTALKDGVRGDRIPVRNVNSKRVIEGIVDGPGKVTVRAGP